MSFKKLVLAAAAVLSLAACSKSNDSKSSGAAAVSAPALDNQGTNVGTYSAGTPLYTFDVASGALMVDGAAIEHVDDSTFAGYPMLASQVADLSATNRVIQTKENSLELWASDSLLLAFDLRGGSPSLLHSRSGNFQIVSATWAMSNAEGQGQKQGLTSADLTINMQECAVEQKQEQGKDQGQDQGKAPIDQGKQGQDQGKAPIDQGKQGQDQGKAPIDQGKAPIDQGKQGQDQGKKFLVADTVGGQGQGQGQEQGKEEKGQQCKTASMTFHLNEIAQPKQEQDQGKQGQDQGKAPIDQGKQGQDQGKAPIDQGKQGQDQGKAPIDQGKQGQDQGKAPIDQGKQGQDQGKAPIDQGKQGQDQGKDQAKPVDQGKDQSKPVDQGKDQSKPVDQGKQGQDQGKK